MNKKYLLLVSLFLSLVLLLPLVVIMVNSSMPGDLGSTQVGDMVWDNNTPIRVGLGLLPGLYETAQDFPGSKVVLGGFYNLGPGESLNEDLVVFGGSVVLDPGSTVDGNVVLLGGNLQANGTITGSLLAMGGLVQLSETTIIQGDVSVLGGLLQGENQAQIEGQIAGNLNDLPLVLPGNLRISVPDVQLRFNPFWDFLWLLFQSLLWSAVAVLVVLFLAQPLQRVGDTAISQALVSGGLGVLSALVVPLLLLIIAVTIIGIPIALLGVLALVIAWAYGLVAIGTQVGSRLSKLSGGNWALPLSAALGTFLLTLIINIVGKVIPCIGWLAPFLVGAIGLGAVLLTRFGSRPYPTEIISVGIPPADEIQK